MATENGCHHSGLNNFLSLILCFLLKALSTELLVVIYRHLMTRDNPETEKLLLSVVKQVSRATLERIERAKSDENEADQLESDISQGKSVVFSMLEISLYVVSKYAPEMIPAASRKPKLHATKKFHKGTDPIIFMKPL